MSIPSILAQLFALLVLVVGLSLLWALLFPLVKPWIMKLQPATLVRWLSLYALIPVASAALSLLIYRTHALSDLLVGAHCHAGECGPHDLYLPVSNAMSVSLLTAGLAILVLFSAFAGWQLRINSRFSDTLKLVSQNKPHRGYRVIESAEPAAWCAGLWQPVVYVSRGLIKRASAEQLALVLHHEICHARHLDTLKLLMVRWLTLPWPAIIRQPFLTAISNAVELRCDLYALTKVPQQQPERVLAQVCQAQGAVHEHRLEAISRAIQNQQANTLASLLAAYGTITVGGLLLTLMAVKAGHPLIEFLMQ